MRPEDNWVYHVRQIITDDEFTAWLVALGGAAVLTLATVLMGLR